MTRRRPHALAVAILMPFVLQAPAVGQDGTHGEGAGKARSGGSPDPWATTRSCTRILDRFAACASDKSFRKQLTRWTLPGDAGVRVPPKRLENKLRAWSRPDRRREQCAIWTRRDGAGEHVGEKSRLADLVAGKPAACASFAAAIEQDGWILSAIADERP